MTTTPTTPARARNVYPGRCGGFNQWVKALAQELINTTPPPRDAILSHHGLHFYFRGLAFRISPFANDGHPGAMVVIMERMLTRCDWKEAHGRPRIVGFKARTWQRLRAAAALAFGGTIRTSWNGGDGDNTASFTMATPANLRWMETAVANYRAMPNVFKATEDEQARVKAMDGWEKGIGSIMNVRHRRELPTYHLITRAAIEVKDGPESGRRMNLTGDLFTPADFPAAERRAAFDAARHRIHATGQAYFPHATELAITLYPNPNQ